MGKGARDQQEMLFQKGINWNDFDEALKRGTLFVNQPEFLGLAVPAPRDKLELLKLIPEKTNT